VAAVLGLDPTELEPEEGAGDADDGVAGGLDDGDSSPMVALAPLLEAVTEEITYRWRSATAGRWSPQSAKPSAGACTPYVYLDKRLKAVDAARYAAAGILPYLAEEGVNDALAALGAAGGGVELIVGGDASDAAAPPRVLGLPAAPRAAGALPPSALAGLSVLLARQGPGKRRKTLVARLLLLGGKREGGDASPLATALREAKEETSGLLSGTSVRKELLGPVLWVPQGRFALFLYGVPPRARTELPAAFDARPRAPTCEVDSLEWVPLVDVLARSRAARRGVAPFARAVVSAPPLVRFFVTAAEDAASALAAQLSRAPPNTPDALRSDAVQLAALAGLGGGGSSAAVALMAKRAAAEAQVALLQSIQQTPGLPASAQAAAAKAAGVAAAAMAEVTQMQEAVALPPRPPRAPLPPPPGAAAGAGRAARAGMPHHAGAGLRWQAARALRARAPPWHAAAAAAADERSAC
jgi:8-oxo-dGTP pyrophosphatase MutT (NUDIX family)